MSFEHTDKMENGDILKHELYGPYEHFLIHNFLYHIEQLVHDRNNQETQYI